MLYILATMILWWYLFRNFQLATDFLSLNNRGSDRALILFSKWIWMINKTSEFEKKMLNSGGGDII